MEDAKKFAAFIKLQMDNVGIDGTELAKRTALARVTISRHMNGHRLPHYSTRVLYARAFKTEPDQFEKSWRGLVDAVGQPAFTRAEIDQLQASRAALSQEISRMNAQFERQRMADISMLPPAYQEIVNILQTERATHLDILKAGLVAIDRRLSSLDRDESADSEEPPVDPFVEMMMDLATRDFGRKTSIDLFNRDTPPLFGRPGGKREDKPNSEESKKRAARTRPPSGTRTPKKTRGGEAPPK